MGLARTWAVGLDGIVGGLVAVEADLAAGLPGTTVIGMGDAAISQARDRVRSAVQNSGVRWPDRRITLALSPASLRKSGAGYDVALAVAVLAAAGVVPAAAIENAVFLGELGLNGQVRPVPGVLPSVLAARDAGHGVAFVAAANLAEAALTEGVAVLGVRRLAELIGYLRGDDDDLLRPDSGGAPAATRTPPDLADVVGQPEARLALEMAAAGGHHLVMIGPPGAGKSMLANRLPGILPPLDGREALEVTALYSVAGRLPQDVPLISTPPFVDPHHTASVVAVVGGGTGTIRPGSVSLAHRGVLFLDEAPEFARRVLDSLRQPMEDGSVLIARSAHAVRYPARFQLVLAANPCPCAAARDVDCSCPGSARRTYLSRLSGPLLDRVDIRVDLPPLDPATLLSAEPGEASAPVAHRVQVARERARRRWAGTTWRCSAEVPGPVVRRCWRPDRAEEELLARAVRTGRLTGRGYDRVLRLALTAADLAGRTTPSGQDVVLALALRSGESL